jgi:hypothetical protein
MLEIRVVHVSDAVKLPLASIQVSTVEGGAKAMLSVLFPFWKMRRCRPMPRVDSHHRADLRFR